MPNILKLTVDNPEDLLNIGAYGAGALIRLQTAATEAGAYADVAGTGSTPTVPLVAGIRSYTAFDPAGIATSWYRTRYENAGATRASDWSDPFQVSEEGSGLICSLYDVKQRLAIDPTDSTHDEDILGFIREVTDEIQGFTGQLFVRTPSSGSDTFLLDVEVAGGSILVPYGVAAIDSLEVASVSQPSSGGTYTTIPSTDFGLRPSISPDGRPWHTILLGDTSAFPSFYTGQNVIRFTGALGWARIPEAVAGIARSAVVRRYLAKRSGSADLAVTGPGGGMTVLRSISPAEMATLARYRVPSIG